MHQSPLSVKSFFETVSRKAAKVSPILGRRRGLSVPALRPYQFENNQRSDKLSIKWRAGL